jgi:hypothetical protein
MDFVDTVSIGEIAILILIVALAILGRYGR